MDVMGRFWPVALLLLVAAARAAPPAVPDEGLAAQVRVSTGELTGVRAAGVTAFLGIPYAAPPLGADRWRAPHPPISWSGSRAADHFAASCWQRRSPQGFGPWTHEYVVDGPVSEDCLYLNVWTSAPSGARSPVLVWIHGGGFTGGSGSVAVYDGATLARQGIVVVTINYRLGVLGFFAHPTLTQEARESGTPPGNFGLQDVIAALHWLHGNLTAFGGDPDAITIAGQSAGAMIIHDLLAAPLASGLFARAIAESGLPVMAPSLADAEATGQELARAKGAATLAELRALTPEQLDPPSSTAGPRFPPIVDRVLVRDSPTRIAATGPINDTPMLVGMTADETSAFSKDYGTTSPSAFDDLLRSSFGPLASRFAALYPSSTDAQRAAASRQLLRDQGLAALYAWSQERLALSHRPLYGYLWDHAEPGPSAARYGAFHSSEIPYVFRTFDKAPDRPFSAQDSSMSLTVSGYWVNFVKRGDPNGPGLPAWPRMQASHERIMELGDTLKPRPILPPSELEAVKELLAKDRGFTLF
jgi:para-nitrobenzyl esterase